jgi:CTP synthase
MPDILICRAEVPLTMEVRKKLSLFCNVPLNCVIEELDVSHSIYEVPLILSDQGIDELLLVHYRIARPQADLTPWRKVINAIRNPRGEVTIGVVGKYQELQDAYKSIFEALDHGCIAHSLKLNLKKIASEEIEQGATHLLEQTDGILIPGGFGNRGIEGKVAAVQYAREHNIPFFGICLGMQCAVVEYARNVCGLAGANSTEINAQTSHPVVCLMEEQKDVQDMGATMRLGAWDCKLQDDTIVRDAYGKKMISERHRHRYEFNNRYRDRLKEGGLVLAGTTPDEELVEIVEVKEHPWFVGVQFHPEFKSQPFNPHPLFAGFIGAAKKRAGRTSSAPVGTDI